MHEQPQQTAGRGDSVTYRLLDTRHDVYDPLIKGRKSGVEV
jgi:hypothetical protein